jgi:hypothetical protein
MAPICLMPMIRRLGANWIGLAGERSPRSAMGFWLHSTDQGGPSSAPAPLEMPFDAWRSSYGWDSTRVRSSSEVPMWRELLFI